MVDGNGTETGHIIVTTIGGKNGQPKQVSLFNVFALRIIHNLYVDKKLTGILVAYISCTTCGFCDMYFVIKVSYRSFLLSFQTISYMAERVVGQGSFGIVFQVVFQLHTLNN